MARGTRQAATDLIESLIRTGESENISAADVRQVLLDVLDTGATVEDLIAGENVTISANAATGQITFSITVPASDVVSVNGQQGEVVLTPELVGAATEAQGALAESAVQPEELVSADASNALVIGSDGGVYLNAGALGGGGGGGGAVLSVNGQQGAVVLGAGDVGAADAAHGHTLADISDAGGAAGAEIADFAAAAHGHTLADISDAGSAAGAETADFATAAQGTKADLAVPSDVSGITGASVLANAVVISQADYDALGSTDPQTLYVVVS